MKKLSFLILLLALAAIALPAAARGHTEVGTRFLIPIGPYPGGEYAEMEFPANTPFHVKHGWVWCMPIDSGGFAFELDVDGENVHWDYHDVDVVHHPACDNGHGKWWWYITNFPDGMTGSHTFTGHWLRPCRDADLFGRTCDPPRNQFEVATGTLLVTFTD